MMLVVCFFVCLLLSSFINSQNYSDITYDMCIVRVKALRDKISAVPTD